MNTNALAFGIIGFLLGGLVVSVAATQFDDDNTSGASSSEMNMRAMTDDLAGKTGDDFDAAFISHMIEHHESAVDMSKLVNENAKHDEIKQLSRDIITAQESEIAKMKRWQKDWGYNIKEHQSMGH
jgi:uncharacterized protein (DUF305 family)